MRHSYTFRRLLLCDRCSARMYGESHAHKGQPPLLGYGCITARERHDCGQRFVASPTIEAQVTAWLDGLTVRDIEPDWSVVEAALAADERPVIRGDNGNIKFQLGRVQEMFQMGHLTREQYGSKSRGLTALLDDGLPEGTTSGILAGAAAQLDNLARLWMLATDEEKGSVATALSNGCGSAMAASWL